MLIADCEPALPGLPIDATNPTDLTHPTHQTYLSCGLSAAVQIV